MGNPIFAKIEEIINANGIVIFMKGTAEFPQCGFSSVVVQIFKNLDVKFKDVNVLEDADIREGIKQYSDWPTIPQIYIKQEFIGGCDIMKEMYAQGELLELLKEKKLIPNIT